MPRTEGEGGPKRLPTSGILLGAWICVFAIAVALLALTAARAIMVGRYLYHREGEGDSSGPVVEYLDEDNAEPDFLYGPGSPPPRVVEFYAPWCPHCVHYAPKYVKLAKAAVASRPTVKFHAVSCVVHKDLCKKQEIKSYPRVKLFPAGSYEALNATKRFEDPDKLLEALGFEAGGVSDGEGGEVTEQHEKKEREKKEREKKKREKKEIARVVPFRVHDVHDAWEDASTSFEFALKNAIYMENGPLPKEKADAFREWLELLSKTLPPQMGRTHDIVDAVLKEFTRASSGQERLDELVRERVRREPAWRWRTCTYGDNGMGYTCGLWQLFHVMSVGVVEYNTHNPPIPTLHASETLRNYIDHFFQCDVCRMNFLSMYDTCAFDACHRLSGDPSMSEREWRELPLWLWETHNDVNVRLLGERLAQNHMAEPNEWESHQARWPALFACPDCWREDRSWEEEKVYEHLHGMYWNGNPSYIKIPSASEAQEQAQTNVAAGRSRTMALKWKLSAIIVAVAAMLARLSTSKKGRRFSGKHKR